MSLRQVEPLRGRVRELAARHVVLLRRLLLLAAAVSFVAACKSGSAPSGESAGY